MKKTLIQFLYEQGIEHRMPHVYLDMDGVLVNLEKGAFKVHGANLGDVPKPERWDKINTIKDFWKNLEWMPGAEKLWNFLKPYAPSIMSAWTKHDPNSAGGKADWLKSHVGKLPRSRVNLVMRQDKNDLQKMEEQNNLTYLLMTIQRISESGKRMEVLEFTILV